MKKIQYIISALLLVAVAAMSLSSCNEDKLGPTIFPDVDETLDPNSTTYKLDKFLKENYLDKYNLTFLYKMPDVSTNMNYNLVPAKYENAIDMAVVCKYLWFDVYDKLAGEDFLKSYGPRIILLLGSSAISPSTRTETVGLAEGGVKISLFKINFMNANDPQSMNDDYFHTMHHEFTHILHQTKIYPTEFRAVSVGHYVPSEWRDRGVEICSEGFVTNYAASEYNEDFAETVACYIVYTDAQWQGLLNVATSGWYKNKQNEYCRYYRYPDNDATQDAIYINQSDEQFVNFVYDADGTEHMYWKNDRDPGRNRIVVYNVPDEDGIDGREAILQKVQIARQWFHDSWNVDLDAVRQEVRDRQRHYNINDLRKMVNDIQ